MCIESYTISMKLQQNVTFSLKMASATPWVNNELVTMFFTHFLVSPGRIPCFGVKKPVQR